MAPDFITGTNAFAQVKAIKVLSESVLVLKVTLSPVRDIGRFLTLKGSVTSHIAGSASFACI